MDKSQVISKLIDYYKLQRNMDFAAFFGISEQNAYGWKRGSYNVYVLYEKCKEVNPEWLLSDGEVGEMLREDKKAAEAMNEDCRAIIDKAMDNVNEALARVAEEQRISKSVLSQTDKIIDLVRDTKG